MWQISRLVTNPSAIYRDASASHICWLTLRKLEGDGAMLKVDPWCKAAECQRAIEIIADPERRVVLNRLRSLWIALCNEPSFDELELSTITRIHTQLMSVYRNAMH